MYRNFYNANGLVLCHLGQSLGLEAHGLGSRLCLESCGLGIGLEAEGLESLDK